MRVYTEFTSNEDIVLPKYYNHVLQGLFYRTISPPVSDDLHNKGFNIFNKQFKLFTFSRILQHGYKVGEYLNFGKNISIQWSSPLDELIKDFVSNLQKHPIRLGRNTIRLNNVAYIQRPQLFNRINFRTLSPVTMHTTLIDSGERIVHYYKPTDHRLNKLLTENAIDKYNAWALYTNKPLLTNGRLTLKIVKWNPKHNIVYVKYKDTEIMGWTGQFILVGTPELINIVYDAGLGDKNSQGFGMIDIC